MARDNSSFAEAQKCHEAGDFDAAERLYEKALAGNPDHVGAWYLLGYLDIQRGRPQSALQRMDKAVALKPDNRLQITRPTGTVSVQWFRREWSLAS